jgi:predicted metalloprotease
VYFNTATGSSRAATASKPFICKSCDTVPLKTSKYGVIKEKFCANPIDNAAECKTAATELGHIYRQPIGYFNSNGNSASYGPGCVITGTSVYFNTATGSSRAAHPSKPFICKGTKTVEPKKSVYGVIKSQFCAEPIFTADECKTAATELGHVYRQQIGYFNSNGNSASYGPGCVVTGTSVYFNTASGSSRAAHPSKPFICKGTKTVPLKLSVYGVIKSEFCKSPIFTAAECKIAAAELGKVYRQQIGYFNSNGNSASYGPGCVVSGTSVYFNTVQGSSRAAAANKPFICKGQDTVPLAKSAFAVIKSDFCANPIDDAAECKTAATALGKNYRQEISYFNSGSNPASYGPGCVVTGSSVYYNKATGSTRAAATNKPFICTGSETASLKESVFGIIKSEFCETPVPNADECKNAAQELGYAYRQSSGYYNSNGRPASYGPGCFVTGTSVYYNTATGSSRAATASRPLLCMGKKHAPQAKGVFGEIKSEFCKDPVPNAEECKKAALEQGYLYRTSSAYYNNKGQPGSYGPGCFVIGNGVIFNKAAGSTRAATATRPLLCKSDEHAPLEEGAFIVTQNKFCEKPITNAEDCKQAAMESGHMWRTSSRYNKGTFGPGCFVYGTGVIFNTNLESYASSVPLLCKGKTTEAPTMQPTVPPTDAPTTNPYPKQCNPYECNDWTCKTWCTCFTAHPEIIKIFEGENPSALDQSFRASCPSDNDECDCDDFVYDISGNQN